MSYFGSRNNIRAISIETLPFPIIDTFLIFYKFKLLS